MSDRPVISVEDLGKTYRIRHQGGRSRYVSLRDVIAEGIGGWFRRGDAPENRSFTEDFWALREVSFEVRRGEVVGIIGRNGAGKSTLLKILSRITEPSEGRVRIKGRVASLLEVGTGFHPELTGRENIYLNGAILGMSRAEIRTKFDEIIAFAEVEQFLDTPVKRYSSGMYVRLAFAVAAHLEPEILIIDEVLAVGDAQFQKKCLGKMQDVSTREGRTVLFVSHNLTAVQTLCGKAIHLKSGRVAGLGPVESQIAGYLQDTQAGDSLETKGPMELAPGLRLNRLSFHPNPVASGQSVEFTVELAATTDVRLNEMAILIYSNFGVRVAILDPRPHGVANLPIQPPGLTLRGTIQALPLVEGDYPIGLYISTDALAENYVDLARLQVIASPNCEHVPYPAMYRGLVELNFSLTAAAMKKEAS